MGWDRKKAVPLVSPTIIFYWLVETPASVSVDFLAKADTFYLVCVFSDSFLYRCLIAIRKIYVLII